MFTEGRMPSIWQAYRSSDRHHLMTTETTKVAVQEPLKSFLFQIAVRGKHAHVQVPHGLSARSSAPRVLVDSRLLA